MKKLTQRCIALYISVIIVFSALNAQESVAMFHGNKVVENSIIVITEKTGLSKSTTNSIKTLASQIASDVKSIIPQRGTEEWIVSGDMDAALERLNAVPGITAFPNYVYDLEPTGKIIKSADGIPADPYFSYQWALNNTGAAEDSIAALFGYSELESSIAGADIDMIRAWKAMETKTMDTVLVVVFDTGIDYNHPDLQGKLWMNPNEIPDNGVDDDDNGFIDDYHGYDAADDDSDPMDIAGHGTGVSGIIAATIDTIGMSGIAPNVKLIAVKVETDAGSFATLGILRGFYYVSVLQKQLIESSSNTRIVAINHSWGGYHTYSENNMRNLEVTKNYALEHSQLGIAWLCSAGNGYVEHDEDLLYRYPSTIQVPNIIAIGATDYTDNIVNIWWGSDHGMASVDVGAPGLQVLSTAPGGYQEFGGTSGATPHAVGVFAAAKGLYPAESYNDIFIRLMAGADRNANYDGFWMTEARLNALNTIQPDSMGLSITYNVSELLLLCRPEDGEALGNAGFVNGTGSSVNVSTVTLTYADAAMESRTIDISDKNLTIGPNGAFGVAVRIPLDEIIAGDNGNSRSGTIEFAGVGSIPFEVQVKQYPSISVSPEFTVLPPVAWGETVSSEFTISNSGDIDLEFLIGPEIFFYSRDPFLLSLALNKAPAAMIEESKQPRDFEEVIAFDNQIISETFKNSDRPMITLDIPEPGANPFMIYWSDSLNDATQVAKDWDFYNQTDVDSWELIDIDTSETVNNVFLAGDLNNGYQNNIITVAFSPWFNFRSIIESTEKIPVYLQFDYAAELEEDHDYFYIIVREKYSAIKTIATTARDLSSMTDSARTVMIDISPWLSGMVYADSVTFAFVANMDESNSAGFGVLFDNVSLWLGESPLVYRDASGNGVLEDVVAPGQDFPISLTLNTAAFPEGEIDVASFIISNDPHSYYSLSLLVATTEYGNATVSPEYTFIDSVYRGEELRSEFSIINDGHVDIEYLTISFMDYQPSGQILKISMPELTKNTAEKPEIAVDHATYSNRFISRLSEIKNRPILQSNNQKAVSTLYKAVTAKSQSEVWSWMESFDGSLEFPDGWTANDYTYGLGSNWAIDSIEIEPATMTNVALFGDLTTLKYYNDSECDLESPWIPILASDSTKVILEFDYSTMLELGWDWFDVWVIWRQPGDETGETWREMPIATNDPDWDGIPTLSTDPERHTFSTSLPTSVKGKEMLLAFYIYTDGSVNSGYTLLDNVKLYQKELESFITNPNGELAQGESVTLQMAFKNTTDMQPGDYNVTTIIGYFYEYDSLYTSAFDIPNNILIGINATEFTILNHEPIAIPDTIYTVSGQPVLWSSLLYSISQNDVDLDDPLRVVDFGEPIYGSIKNLFGTEYWSENPWAWSYIAPIVPESMDMLEDHFMYWVSDGWVTVGTMVTINVLQYPQFIRSAQHVFPINEDDSLTIDMMRLAAGLATQDIDLTWKSGANVSLSKDSESSLLTIVPAADFFGTSSAWLYLEDEDGVIDSTLIQFVVNSVNDMPVAALSMNVAANQVSFTDLSHDRRDKDGGIVAWQWNFGDALTSDEQNPVHVYADSGSFLVSLTVTDNAGAQSSVEMTIQIAAFVGLADAERAIPEKFQIHQNYPNPFNPTTMINYDIPKEALVRIDLYDLSGRLINTFINEKHQAGFYSIHWDASRYSSGVYIYRIQAGGFSAVKKCILMK
ncbi:MAG: S8 family serine peptidase [Candidatus Marinimicrobia bacterium]|nr:S8 family serine peptidase [Candidatus Neomarinimicrobiota bacterium]